MWQRHSWWREPPSHSSPVCGTGSAWPCSPGCRCWSASVRCPAGADPVAGSRTGQQELAEWAGMSTTSRPRVLLVEDDGQLGPLIVELLGDDFDLTLVRDGQQGLHLGLTRGWD